MRKPEKVIKLVAANGTPIKVEGEQVVEFNKDGRKYGMNFLVSDAKKPLASVGAIVDQGSRVVFDGGKKGSYIENKASGEKIYLTKKNGTFVMDINVDEVKREKIVKMDVGAARDDMRREDFRRQVR